MKLMGLEVDREYHIKVKMRAMTQGKTLKQYMLDLINEDLEKAETKEKE